MGHLEGNFTAINNANRSDLAASVGEWLDLAPDEIGHQVILAYIQLVFRPTPNGGSRSVTVIRTDSLEVCLTELRPEILAPGMPQFWLEAFALPGRLSLDSLGLFELDDADLMAVAEFISAIGSQERAEAMK